MGRAGQFKKGCIPWNKGKKSSEETKNKIRKARKNQRMLPYTEEAKNKIRTAINKHHIDLDHNNTKESNILYLNLGNHNSLHRKAYDFLVKSGVILEYTDWFLKEFNPKLYTKYDYTKQQKIKNIDKEKRRKQRGIKNENSRIS